MKDAEVLRGVEGEEGSGGPKTKAALEAAEILKNLQEARQDAPPGLFLSCGHLFAC